MEPIRLEHSAVVERSAAEVWASLSELRGDAMPGMVDGVATLPDSSGRPRRQHLRLSDDVAMEQQIVESDDASMRLRVEMIEGSGVPWSSFRLESHVEPTGANQCRVSFSCAVTPTAEPRHVQGMLHGLVMLALKQLKTRSEE